MDETNIVLVDKRMVDSLHDKILYLENKNKELLDLILKEKLLKVEPIYFCRSCGEKLNIK